jgi:hypothetical protein
MPPRVRAAAGHGKSQRKAGQPVSVQSSNFKVGVDVRETQQSKLSELQACYPSLHTVDDSLGIFKEIVPVKFRGKSLNLDAGYTLHKWEPLTPESSNGWLTITKGTETTRVLAYQKCIPLMNTYSWLRFKERPSIPFLWNYQKHEIVTPENQGYVDCVASSLVAKLKELVKSPHFCTFYGAFRGVSKIFYCNLEEDLEEYRFTNWFWAGLDAGEYGLRVIEKATGRRLSVAEYKSLLKPDDEFLHDDETDSEESDETGSTSSSGELGSLGAESISMDVTMDVSSATVRLEEVDTIGIESSEIQYINRRKSGTPKTVHSGSDESDSSEASYTEEYSIHAELYEMPVAIQYLEYCEGTMDELLENTLHAPIVTSEQETMWAAWLFQVCVACTQYQNVFRLTHNDLHTANVLWKKTAEEFLYYSDTKGRKWKVPTFGYIFSIIDYGRAIFSVNNFMVISSDYNDGADADGMYNFGPIEDPEKPRVGPNRSFDLCRLSCGLLRGLYPQSPPSKPKGPVLTKEDGWEVRETNHPVFNLLWSWLKVKSGGNILETERGEEKYPGFELYSEIAATVGDAVPESQLGKGVFQSFLLKPEHATEPRSWIVVPL